MVNYVELERKLNEHLQAFMAREGLDALEFQYAALGRPSNTVVSEVKFARHAPGAGSDESR